MNMKVGINPWSLVEEVYLQKVRVEKEPRECKGKTLLHMIRPVTYAHAVTLVEDHQDKWHQDRLVAKMLDKEEREKYKNHKKIECPQERVKYAPKKAKILCWCGSEEEVW